MADLDRLAQRARAARDHVRLEWDDGHVDVLLRRTKARARRRTVYRVAVAAAAVIVLSLSAAVFLPDRVPERVAARALVVQSSETERVLHLADGSVVALLGEDSDVVIMRVSEEEIRLRLTRGAARFQVVPGLERAFRVNAGDVDIDVLGTTFEVRRDGAGARVRVLEGQVRVTWPPAHEARLTAGGEGRFPGREPTVHVPEEARKKRAAAEPPTVESPATEPPAVESPNSKPELASAPHGAPPVVRRGLLAARGIAVGSSWRRPAITKLRRTCSTKRPWKRRRWTSCSSRPTRCVWPDVPSARSTFSIELRPWPRRITERPSSPSRVGGFC